MLYCIKLSTVNKNYLISIIINQSEAHLTNAKLYEFVKQQPISTTIRQRQLQFIGHCLRIKDTDELARIYALYESDINPSRPGRPKRTYLDQIAEQLCTDRRIKLNAYEITSYAQNKSNWNLLVVAPQKPAR